MLFWYFCFPGAADTVLGILLSRAAGTVCWGLLLSLAAGAALLSWAAVAVVGLLCSSTAGAVWGPQFLWPPVRSWAYRGCFYYCFNFDVAGAVYYFQPDDHRRGDGSVEFDVTVLTDLEAIG